jgi:hypothetical protein
VHQTWILTGSPENHAPAEHWALAFQGQIRPVSEHDAEALMERLTGAARAPALR